MLIAPVTRENLGKWFGPEAAPEGIAAAAARSEAFMAIDRMSGECLGVVALSRAENAITCLDLSSGSDCSEAATRLVETALNQLDGTREVVAATGPTSGLSPAGLQVLLDHGFTADSAPTVVPRAGAAALRRRPTGYRKGGSFHRDYAGYMAEADEAGCSVCLDAPGPADVEIICELASSWVEASTMAQGGLWGKCHVLAKKHFVELHEVPTPDLADFMADVQRAGKALKAVTGAVKINYELHANTLPHLHVHLFPRYVDDAFAGRAIDFTTTTPSPYRSRKEFDFFVAQMRAHLGCVREPDSDRVGNGHRR
jgi:diadenosine tetraphosphate (Ap4A) HIT family hydrolase